MRERDLQVLEFDKVLQLLAGCALSSAGQEACLALRPQTTAEEVEAESERTWQFFRLLEAQLTLPLRGFPDIRPSLQWAAHEGAALEGQKLLEVLEVVALVGRVHITVEARLRKVEDVQAIHSLLVHYGRELDKRDYKAYGALFAQDGSWKGGMGTETGPDA